MLSRECPPVFWINARHGETLCSKVAHKIYQRQHMRQVKNSQLRHFGVLICRDIHLEV
jgi:hypothetical protein